MMTTLAFNELMQIIGNFEKNHDVLKSKSPCFCPKEFFLRGRLYGDFQPGLKFQLVKPS